MISNILELYSSTQTLDLIRNVLLFVLRRDFDSGSVVRWLWAHAIGTIFSDAQRGDKEYEINQQQNIADAMVLLPRLATGIDVNVRYRQ